MNLFNYISGTSILNTQFWKRALRWAKWIILFLKRKQVQGSQRINLERVHVLGILMDERTSCSFITWRISGIPSLHQCAEHGMRIKKDLEVDDFEIVVNFDDRRSEKFQQLSSGFVSFVRASPLSPVSPGKRHLRGAYTIWSLIYLFFSNGESKATKSLPDTSSSSSQANPSGKAVLKRRWDDSFVSFDTSYIGDVSIIIL